MILIWRGWGLAAVVALFPLLASCGGLISIEPFWIWMLAATLSLLLGGGVCVYCGNRWNRDGTEHSFYFIPLQYWGWFYFTASALFPFSVAIGAFTKKGLDMPQRLIYAVTGTLALSLIVGIGLFLFRSGRTKSITDDLEREKDEVEETEKRNPWDHR